MQDRSYNALSHPQKVPVFTKFYEPGDIFKAAHFLSNASHLAYYDRSKTSQILKKHALKLVHYFRQKSTHAYLAQSKDYAVLAFRGTQHLDFENIKTDGTFKLIPAQKGQVHQGFQEALDLIWPELNSYLKEIKTPLYITGHSLGGALATLAG
ncbi:hypothetical protein JKY72_05560 [Candidatus Gracilibacteria bacterium]|nr:hypothetical protein [Candidatus Gracilibacteria bacterium]